jgi:hypothetical protein
MRRDALSERAKRPERINGTPSIDEVLTLQLITTGRRRGVEAKVRQCRGG